MVGRFGNALFELALEEKAIDAVKKDLEQFDALIAANPDLARLVRSPVFGADEQLSDKNVDALKSALKSVTGGKDIDFDVKIDPAIIGGLIVKVGSRMVDTSLRTKLNAIKIAMKEAR